ncbi:PP2C family serine/threonine-protein phosphatase [Nocardia arthritidis]|uniref:PPM-type phosphatase domain-containing protein n=1 Tax=Nocardia arthritidis TaxID=228602 RepID=A0A6G9Y823_9NOCA|nr:PP2C family serine/threonine-protein phosphatase [Nocardia arthritidis]QIS09294.1 hypothetical protein F5544_06920 [Nocardia arthritidis]
MKIAVARLPMRSGDDRVFTTDRGAIILDGATSFDPDVPSASEYVDVLGAELLRRLDGADDLETILADAISTTARRLKLDCGSAPSSTVALVRIGNDAIDVLVLGDSSVVVGRNDQSYRVVTDERLAGLNLPETDQYRARLKSGGGYDETHRALLRALQNRQRGRRNHDGGYWIAEADPGAAKHAFRQRFSVDETSWIVMATDGVSNLLAPLKVSWPEVAQLDDDNLARLLAWCHEWEAVTDPNGQQQPRAKRHDDKALAVIRL